MKIKTGDKVIVVAGKDRGKTAKVLEAFPKEDKVLVEGVNMVKKHPKSRKADEKPGIIEKAMPVHVSNVALVDPKSGKPTRIKIERINGKRVRVTKNSGSKLQN